ncbi:MULTISPECIES: transcription elongation factor GreA [Dialister]|jgi:transcription elongation factor GreA|uniref:Transcription elongation factor GreA n=3 Tax=Dialister hominis TaxID=2582419 RepID=A0A8D4UUY4_9FIRM|nr:MULTISPECIES: transcription elongation factor GreA [Dialister]MBS6412886.1 transcription elongation factor GreA [Dialister sp.]MEE1349101.1 transcription elongation factor GreA [Dialister hominis]BBK25458.1 transcription elongation factor GreA [Dialister hominis]
MAEMQKTLITKEGLEKMQKELEDLRTTKRAEVAQRLKEAIAMGDLSENSEYDEAKNAQAFLEGRIVQLEQQIRTAQIIVKGKKNRIDVGSTVTIEDMEEYVKETVTIVGSAESNPFEGRISNESPVGRALVGAKAGDIVEADAPNSVIKYKVISIDD